MLTARQKFSQGDLVVMTRCGRRHLKHCLGRPPTTEAVVVGFCRSSLSVNVCRKGHKTPESYHISFWKRRFRA